MQRVIRVYAIVDLVALGAFLAIFASIGFGVGNPAWNLVANLVLGDQLWVLLVIPLGVLASSDAVRMGRRGWLAAFITLTVLAVVAPRIDELANAIHDALFPLETFDLLRPGSLSSFIGLAEEALAFFPVPLAALGYTFLPTRSATRDQSVTGPDARPLIVVGAVIGLLVMGALGPLANFPILEYHIRTHSTEQLLRVADVQHLLSIGWVMLLNALPVAIASLAMIDAARTGRRAWVAGWIAIAVLTVVVAGLLTLVAEVIVLAAIGLPGQTLPFAQQLQDASIVAPLVVTLVALGYVLATRARRRPADGEAAGTA